MSKSPHIPCSLPPADLDHSRLIGEVGRANAALSKYEGLLQTVPNPDLLLSTLTANEAVLSSRIEGTQTTLDELLDAGEEKPVDGASSREQDLQETWNYERTLKTASGQIKERGFTLSLIKECHAQLMDSVRGGKKQPGKFREMQNFIAPPGGTMENAIYIPPDPVQVPPAMENWIQYAQSDADDVLLQTAVLHAQFEIIHSFLDGNGRIGRLIIPLFLCFRGYLSRPSFYLSEYLESRRQEYYDKLLAVTEKGEWTEWVLFFLRATTVQAATRQGQVRRMTALRKRLGAVVPKATHSQYANAVIDFIFRCPRFTVPMLVKEMNIKNATASQLVKSLHEGGVIQQIAPGGGRTPARWAFAELLSIVKGE